MCEPLRWTFTQRGAAVKNETTIIGAIDKMLRLRNTANGNPRYLVTLVGGANLTTKPDAAIANGLANSEYQNVQLRFVLDADGQIFDVEWDTETRLRKAREAATEAFSAYDQAYRGDPETYIAARQRFYAAREEYQQARAESLGGYVPRVQS